MLKPIAIATAISRDARHPVRDDSDGRVRPPHPGMLRFVASGPFPAATDMGTAGAILGLVVHFALMAIMATGLMLLARWKPERLDDAAPHRPRLRRRHLFRHELAGRAAALRDAAAAQGLAIATQLFAHIVLVGIPMTYVAARYLRPPSCNSSCE